jgi:hypothetical protein
MTVPNYQTNYNGYFAYKVQTARGTPAAGAGASLLPLTSGMHKLTKKTIASKQVRQDGMTVRGRHGSQAASASFGGELQLTNYDEIIQAVMRGTWAAGAAITNATTAMSTATMSVTGSVVSFSGGNVITAGARVFDIHVWTSGLNAANLGVPLQVVGVTATTITYAQPLVAVAGPVSTYAFGAKGHMLINPPAGSLVQRYYTGEENFADADVGRVFSDEKWGSLDFAMSPDGIVTITPALMGTGAVIIEPNAGAPYFTTPALPLIGAIPLAAIDCSLVLSDAGILLDVTSLALKIDLGLTAPTVAASKVSPDVFDGEMKVSGSLATMFTDFTQMNDFVNETQLALQLLVTVPGSNPIDFFSLTIPNLTLGGADLSDFSQAAGPMTQTLTISSDLTGVDTRGGAYQSSQVIFQRST